MKEYVNGELKEGDSISVEQANEIHEQNEKNKIINSGDYSGKNNSTITSLSQDEQEKERKLIQLQALIQKEVQAALTPFESQLNQIPNLINQSITQAFQQVQTNSGPMPETMNDMPPEAKIQALSPALTGIAQILQAWKGTADGPRTDPFGEMFKQLGINIMQAGVDGIYKQVYDGYQPQPRNNNIVPRPPGQQPQQGQSTGFR